MASVNSANNAKIKSVKPQGAASGRRLVPSSGVNYLKPYAVRYNAGVAGMPRGGARPQPKKSAPPPVQKRRRKERDYFFIMRRGVCFLMLLLAIVWVAVIAMNYLAIMPQYTSFLVAPDLTPLDDRLDTETGEMDDGGNAIVIPYQDKSVYISFIDPIFGALKALFGLSMTDSEGNSMSPFYDSFSPAIAGTAENTGNENAENTDDENSENTENTENETEGPVAEASENEDGTEATDDTENTEGEDAEGTDGETTEGENTEGEQTATEDTAIKFGYVEANTNIDEEARSQDSMGSIASMAFNYAPIILVVGAVFAALLIVFAFLSLFGRRIFKGFGIMSIIMLLAGLAMFVAGLAAMGNYMGNPSITEDGVLVSVLDFSQLMNFAFGVFQGAPATALDPATDVMPLTLVSGYGMLIILVVPVVILLLSIFARKKVPYSIFDK